MDCTHYKNRLKEAALEPASLAQEADLRAHVEACPGCRAEFERLQLFLSAMGQAVTQSSEGELAPGFAARVRQRAAEQPASTWRWFPGWAPVSAVAALAVILLAIWTRLPQEPPEAPPVIPPVIATAPKQPPVEAGPPSPTTVTVAQAARRPVEGGPRTLVVLIPRDEQEGLRQFIRATQGSRAVAAGSPEARAEKLALPVQSAELAITPLALERVEVRPIWPVVTDSQTQ